MGDLFYNAAILRATYHREPGFNLFTVLRNNSDEVYLHSRFLAYLLNPKGSHGCGIRLLNAFLEVMEVEGFDLTSATVQAEYKSIDIFVQNSQGQAIVIENKIYARDAYEQLHRYNQLVKREGYQKTWNLYLTLDGSEPAGHSKKDLDVSVISYETDIIRWLERCIPLVAREAGLREAIFQYIELLQKLTSTDQGGKYMEQLKKKLKEGDNLLLVADINRAYKEVQIELQAELWERMRTYQAQTYPEMPEPENTADIDAIRNYYTKSKNNRHFGLYYPLGLVPGYAYIELDHYLYFGYHTYGDDREGGTEALLKLSNQLLKSEAEEGDFFWRYPTQNLNYKNPKMEDLNVLRDTVKQQAIAQELIDGVHVLWLNAFNSAAGPSSVVGCE
ncbi:PD-(D/E)XK nuclease family protein [Pseudomonas frederiksbergensis]|uniref:PD-(D/E)XK nuclease superfamily protein n=1 Tax=Pseudomonas frederiksbergensis TaxID=104087 RepID=A0A6L5C112_9PSED|nr:PD-(D/E)XK nuclease family protein [Pseudomonas frederiksbergensis]KAF2394298.1 hypothetical protein FX983_02279 [Pseudomonas frederiksbergensis]